MTNSTIIRPEALIEDLRLLVEYASRAGLLNDKTVLDQLKAAQDTVRTSDPDLFLVTVATNELAQRVFPLTLADLKFGRDPLSEANQRRSKLLQLSLTLFSLVVLVVIGYFMHALKGEQDAIADITQMGQLKPQLKLTALRKMAQYEEPMAKPSILYDEYHQKVAELRQLNGKIYATYMEAVKAHDQPLFPWDPPFHATPAPLAPLAAGPNPSATVTRPTEDPAPPAAAAAAEGANPAGSFKLTAAGGLATTTAPPPQDLQQGPICTEDSGGTIRLPAEAGSYPMWMRKLLSDTLADFCFQLKVLSPGGDGGLMSQLDNQEAFVPDIKAKVSLRVGWFLPFFYGLLGSAIFLMRNVASIRTPAMQWFPIVMRLSLGGVAGIVVGWFSSAASPGLDGTSTLSVPFALAFLTGYGIEVLFTMLDRLNRAVSDTPARSH